MDTEDATYLVHHAMDNICDMDTTLMMYARAAVEALGWRSIKTDVPELDQAVVCTDGTHRWLDMRTSYTPDMIWQGHKPTHWHPIQNIPTPSTPDPGDKPAVPLVDENACPGHVASAADPKVCGRCGTHIDSLRPPEDC